MRWLDAGWPATLRARGGDAACFLAAMVIGGLATDATDITSRSYAELNDLIGLVAATTLFWRRRAPLVVAVLTFAAGAVVPMGSGAAMVALYTVAALCPTRVALAMTLLHVAPAAIGSAVYPDRDLGARAGMVVGLLFTVAALGWGLATRSRHQLMEALAERVERAESEQHARVAEARQAERTRIASEMHDVLAHRLSMLSLHAGAIEYRPGASPDDLARSAGVVRASAHMALDELRAVIGVLRDDASPGLTPPPTATDLGALVAECRDAGMRIDVTGEPGAGPVPGPVPVPPGLGRHLYRIVQEGLTNARKHAPGAPVRLSVTGGPGTGLDVEITNPGPDATALGPGPGPTGDRAGPGGAAIPGAGVGLVGLRERVEMAGGTLEAGLDRTGAHRLHAHLPWPSGDRHNGDQPDCGRPPAVGRPGGLADGAAGREQERGRAAS